MPIPAGWSSELLANRMFEELVGVDNANLPIVDLFDTAHSIPWDENSAIFQPVDKVSINELADNFHVLMEAFNKPLQDEHRKNRITGAEYSKTYIALTQAAMASAVQFTLGKDQAFWLAAKTQAEAITAQNQNELIRIQAMLARAQFAQTKLQLAIGDSQFGNTEFDRSDLKPQQLLLAIEQTKMTTEQMEAQRAQTADTRASDSQIVTGLVGKQKELYDQQKISYQEDIKIKAARVFSDLWTVMKTSDEGIQPSVYFGAKDPDDPLNTAPALDGVFKNLRLIAGADDFTPPPENPPEN